jgi:hypothetical protein
MRFWCLLGLLQTAAGFVPAHRAFGVQTRLCEASKNTTSASHEQIAAYRDSSGIAARQQKNNGQEQKVRPCQHC